MVFADEDVLPRDRGIIQGRGHRFEGGRFGSLFDDVKGEIQDERRAFAEDTFDPDGSLHEINQTFDDG